MSEEETGFSPDSQQKALEEHEAQLERTAAERDHLGSDYHLAPEEEHSSSHESDPQISENDLHIGISPEESAARGETRRRRTGRRKS